MAPAFLWQQEGHLIGRIPRGMSFWFSPPLTPKMKEQSTMAYDFELSIELPAPPHDVYEAWMSSEGHTAMTGGVAHVDHRIGGEYDAWDGYITGKTLELEPGRRIVQSWRTLHFAENDPDSTIEIVLRPHGEATILTLKHRNVPDGQTSYEESGWQDYYFEPMKRRCEWLGMKATL